MENVPNSRLEPANTILAEAGGAPIVARELGLTPSWVYKWTYPREKGGTGGHIPSDLHLPILLNARARGKDLRPEHFFHLPNGLPPLGRAPANDNQPPAANDNHAPSMPAVAVPNHARDGGHNAPQREP